MTIVLVHGNPETDAIWGPLVDALQREDVVRLSPPGFGAPLHDGFPATYLAYRDWLEEALRLVGCDRRMPGVALDLCRSGCRHRGLGGVARGPRRPIARRLRGRAWQSLPRRERRERKVVESLPATFDPPVTR